MNVEAQRARRDRKRAERMVRYYMAAAIDPEDLLDEAIEAHVATAEFTQHLTDVVDRRRAGEVEP
jgi:hypothetical protein